MGRLAQDYEVIADDGLRATMADFFTWLGERLSAVIAEGVRAGEFRPGTDPDRMASLIMAAVQGGYVLARAQQDPAAFCRAVDGARQVVTGLAAYLVRADRPWPSAAPAHGRPRRPGGAGCVTGRTGRMRRRRRLPR